LKEALRLILMLKKKPMSITRILVVVASVATGLLACSKDALDNLDTQERPIYITKADSSANFSSFATFSLADSVAVISNNQLVSRERTEYDAELIDAFAAEMQNRGFTRVAHSSNPDLGISISRIYNDFTGIVDYSDYWGGYGGYWDPYYWGYGGYDYAFPPMYGTYTITDGGVAIDMFDLKNASTSNQLKQVWSGLVRGGGTFTIALAAQHAGALLDQSPYIHR
jgi:hypothetical protein